MLLQVLESDSSVSFPGPRQEVLQAWRAGFQTNGRVHEETFPTGS